MLWKLKTLFPFLMLSVLLCWQPIEATQTPSILRVGISPFSPFVILDENGPVGVSIDAWQALAEELNVQYEYIQCTGVADKLKKLQEGHIDIAIGGITITEDREEIFDFSHPVYHTGLDILIPHQNKFTLRALFASLFSGKKMVFFAGMLGLVLIAGHIIWLVERSTEHRTTRFHRNYIPGVFEGMYWALITASTVGYGDKVPKRWIGRILTGILIIIFLPLFGFFIAQLSSDLTMQSIQQTINGLEDLWGKRVGVVGGTTSHEFMKQERSHLTIFDNVDQAYDALHRNQIDAVVYDAPALMHYVSGKGKDRVKVVGKLFAPQDYGLALPQGSRLREEINRDLLALIESEKIKKIFTKWFGPDLGR